MTLGPTLTDAKGLGGIIAGDGFNYQTWNALLHIPAWLSMPSFDGLIMEGLEDFEARFFAPFAVGTRVLDRYQAKSAQLPPAEVIALFADFKVFDDLHPGAARSHTLVTPGLPPGMQLLQRNLGRVKRARPFYRPFASMLDASEAQLLAQYEAKFGANAGHHVTAVDVELSPNHGRDLAEVSFQHAFDKAFPKIEISVRAAKRVFATLLERLNVDVGRMITRSQLFEVIRRAGVDVTDARALPLRLRAADDQDDPRLMDIDCIAFAGEGGYPGPERYVRDLMEPLQRTATWAREQGHKRISLSGRYRLSTAFAAGWAFRSANGFDIEVPTREAIWPSDAHPAGPRTTLNWVASGDARLQDGRLAVGVGVLRDPAAAIAKTGHGVPPLILFLNEAIPDARMAQEAAREIKRYVDREIDRLKPRIIDLYVAGPAALAALLGHRWNGMPSTQLHELAPSTGTYVRTALLD